jgi:outer membrane protein assembly factor BamB
VRISTNTSWMAIANNEVWLNTTISPGASPAAIGSKGRAYVVDIHDSGYRLHSFEWDADEPHADSLLFSEAPIGSPLLGEPIDDGPAEIYVVTNNGTVRAFDADSLALLWTEALGIPISHEAQPVLVGNTLWVVGLQGQVRGVRVDSNGLNREAPWPKAFRDNCNTSSERVRPDNMPSCF